MSERPTPESDESGFDSWDGAGTVVHIHVARRLERERDAAVEELRNIANAVLSTWDKDMRDQFQAWAQNRARATLRAIEEGKS